MRSLVFTAAVLAWFAAGCAAPPCGTAAQINERAARDAIRQMRSSPRQPSRPIVILNGFHAPAVAARALEREIIDATSGSATEVALVAYPLLGDIDRCARATVEAVRARWPGDDQDQTVPVDVVGLSMGGLVARWAALAPAQRRELLAKRGEPAGEDFPRLRIARLFTFATPHRGSALARLGFSRAARDMRPGSEFLADLDADPRPYPTVPYAHLCDHVVEVSRAAPTGQGPIWHRGTLLLSHISTHYDPVFIADLLRRLRSETPLVSTE